MIGLDLANSVFPIPGVDGDGNAVLKKRLPRAQRAEFFAQQDPGVVAMAACESAHSWARQVTGFGHEPKLVPPQEVKPFVKTHQHEAADAAAIATAARPPGMAMVTVKTPDPQAVLAIHRAREGWVKRRTATYHQIRGLLAECGQVLPVGSSQLEARLPALLEEGENDLPILLRHLLQRRYEHLKPLTPEMDAGEALISSWQGQNDASQRLTARPGVGVLTATALVATVGDAKPSRKGRQVAAALNLVPKPSSSGGKERWLGLRTRGDGSRRRWLIHGARTVWRYRQRDPGFAPTWLGRLTNRRPTHGALVAFANQRAQIIGAMRSHRRAYEPAFKPQDQGPVEIPLSCG